MCEKVHGGTNYVFKGVPVFFDHGCAFRHDKQSRGAGSEVVGDADVPESWGKEEAVARGY